MIRGNESGTTIPARIVDELKKQGGSFDYHSHPFDDDCTPSPSDLKSFAFLKRFTGQDYSKIVTTNGRVTTYDGSGVITVGTVENTLSDEYRKILESLFGGD